MTGARAAAQETGPRSLAEAVRAVPTPAPILDREREAALTDRQREVLDQLGAVFDRGFAERTMADLAAELNCSLRTLYGLAAGRNELVLMVSDRNLRRIGGRAHRAITDDMTALQAVRAYLRAANVAVGDLTPRFADDMNALAEGRALNQAHSDYLVAVTRCLLDLAVERGETAPLDTAAVARAIAGLGRDLSQPEVMATLASSPQQAADDLVDLVVTGLAARPGPAR